MKNINVRTQAHPRTPGEALRPRRTGVSRGAVLLMVLLSLSLVWLLFVLAALVFA